VDQAEKFFRGPPEIRKRGRKGWGGGWGGSSPNAELVTDSSSSPYRATRRGDTGEEGSGLGARRGLIPFSLQRCERGRREKERKTIP